MTSDYVGTATRFCYAKKGDAVELISIDYSGMVLVKNNSVLFHVKKELISYTPTEIIPEPEISLTLADVRPTSYKERTKKTITNSNQQTLF